MADAGKRPWRLLIVGAPGSGKGTQAERLCAELGIPAISTGDMLRQAMASGSRLGRKVESIVESGSLVDDATMEEVIARRLAADDTDRGFLLDGYPRNSVQLEALDRVLAERGEELDLVIFLDVPEDELVRRAVGRGRADDTEEIVRRRLEIYREQTEPIVDTYRDRGLLARIDGTRNIDEVSGDLLRVVEEAA